MTKFDDIWETAIDANGVYRLAKRAPGALYDGIPSQRVADAIRSAEPVVGRTRLVEAAHEGRRLGYLRGVELESLEEYWRGFEGHGSGEWSLGQLREHELDPDDFQIEAPSANRGRAYEMGR